MKLSPLQIARYQYQPKLPGMLRNGISEICVKNGGATESIAATYILSIASPFISYAPSLYRPLFYSSAIETLASLTFSYSRLIWGLVWSVV